MTDTDTAPSAQQIATRPSSIKGKKMIALIAILMIGCGMSIWFYMLYSILVAISATELQWFLFWAYIPVTLIVTMLAHVAGKSR